MTTPGYVALFKDGVLAERAEILTEIYRQCNLCPHKCGINRIAGKKGICRQGSLPVVASANVHTGEEPPISGRKGSGTIFFSGCTGRCIFCQNYPISQLGTGNEISCEQLAEMMLDLQKRGCHNINLVTPTHFIPSFVSALVVAVGKGLSIPIVYNSSGYERVEIIKLLERIVDIYLPDAKYANDTIAFDLSGFRNYVEHNRSALIEMYRQTGILKTARGIATKGIIIRHLILPCDLSGTDEVLDFCSNHLSAAVHISLMNQYFPAYQSIRHEILHRRITEAEYDSALKAYDRHGLYNGWIQEYQTN